MKSLPLHEIDNLSEYVKELEKHKDRYLICAAARDTLYGINDELINDLTALGMKNIVGGWVGYVFLKEADNVILDKRSAKDLSLIEYSIYDGLEIQLVSKSFHAGNKALIVVNEYDFSVNHRGLNIVVIDLKDKMLLDSVCFDFYPNAKSLCIRDKDFIKLKIPECNWEFYGENAFDIDELLDGIIEEFNFDKYYPRFSKCKHAKKAILELVETWDYHESIACIVVGYNSDKIKSDKKNFLSDINWVHRNQIDFYECKFKERVDAPPPYTYLWEAFDLKNFEHIAWKSYSRVYIISNCGNNYVSIWFRKHNIKYTFLYDYLLSCDIYDIPNDSEYYDFIADKRESRFIFSNYKLRPTVYEIYENIQRYKESFTTNFKLIYAQKLFFLFLVERDFLGAKKYLNEIISLAKECESYIVGWKRIEILLKEISMHMKSRSQKDIISIWIDFLGYEDSIKFMPFVASLRERGVWFNNFFSMNGFTHESQRTFFTGRKLIEGKTNKINDINLYNSPLLRVLEKNGYNIAVFGEYLQDLMRCKHMAKKISLRHETDSRLLWDAIRTMSMSKVPCFILLHCLQSHHPYVFAGLDDKSMFSLEERWPAPRRLDSLNERKLFKS